MINTRDSTAILDSNPNVTLKLVRGEKYFRHRGDQSLKADACAYDLNQTYTGDIEQYGKLWARTCKEKDIPSINEVVFGL